MLHRKALSFLMILMLMLTAFSVAQAQEGTLPANPVVITPKNEIGTYGGTLYAGFPKAYAGQAYETLGFYEPILGWNEDLTENIPNLVESYEESEDGLTFTFVIREGLCWSNGDPVTTDDILYAYNDVLLNTDITPVFPVALTSGGDPCTINVIDERAFEIVFTTPNPTFRSVICRQGNTDYLFKPSNYLKQYNNNYTDVAELEKQATEMSLDGWTKLYENKATWRDNPDHPTLYAWQLSSVTDDTMIRVFERNPYYFKADTEGNQLPYLDAVQVEYVENSETLKLKVMSGEIEYIYAPTGETFSEWPTMAQSMETGNYRLVLASHDYPHIFLVMPNHASQDPIKGPLLRDKNFRIALSQAINREEFCEMLVNVADFIATPAQHSPIEESPYYNETLATQYLEYDPDLANQLLDELGLDQRGSDGYRLAPDGSALTFQLTIPTFNDLWVDGGIQIAEYWKAVGLNVEAKATAPDIFAEMNTANQIEIEILSHGSGGMMNMNIDAVNSYAAASGGWWQHWCTEWINYLNTNGDKGLEPPEYVYELNGLREQVLSEVDEAKAAELMDELLTAFGEVFPIIGISRPLPHFLVVSNDLYNTPDDYDPWVIFPFGVGGNVNPCQFYKK